MLCSAAAPRTLKFRKTTDRDANEPWTRERKPLRPDVDRGRRCRRATGEDPSGGAAATGMEHGDGHRGGGPARPKRQAGPEAESKFLAW